MSILDDPGDPPPGRWPKVKTERTHLAGPVTVTKPDGTVEVRPAYTPEELDEILYRGSIGRWRRRTGK